MGVFDFFKSSAGGPAVSENWQRLGAPEEADAFFQESSPTVLIYKHSFACSICTFSLLSLERSLGEIIPQAKACFIDVRAERPLSNYIAQKSGVVHQSPQAIILYKGQAFWHGSHGEVRAEFVLDALSELLKT